MPNRDRVRDLGMVIVRALDNELPAVQPLECAVPANHDAGKLRMRCLRRPPADEAPPAWKLRVKPVRCHRLLFRILTRLLVRTHSAT